MSTFNNNTTDLEEDSLDDTLDGEESLEEWILRRTTASLTGMLTPDDVAAVYSEERGLDVDLYIVTRVLAHYYPTITTLNGELAFRAALPH